MKTQASRVAGYRFRTTFARRWPGYLSVAVLVGLLGGLAMAAVAGARQTESSFSQLYASTNPTNLSGGIAVYNPSAGAAFDSGYSASRAATISHLPLVAHVGLDVGLNMGPVTPAGEPVPSSAGIGIDGSLGGEYFTQDRVLVTSGRLPNPARPDEFVMDAATAKLEGLHLGELVTMGIYSNRELANDPNITPSSGPKPYRTLRMRLVGVGAITAQSAVEDDVDAQSGSLVLMTPALTRQYAACCSSSTTASLLLDGGSRSAAKVRAEIAGAFPGLPISFIATSGAVTKADRSITPEALALGAFGIIAALALLVIAAQVIGRQLRLNADDVEIMRALGADPSTTVSDGLSGTVAAIAGGGLLAVLVALGLSPLAPIGPVRPYIEVGIHADWLVLALGLVALIVILGAVALAIALREAPHRTAERRQRRELSAGGALAAAGLAPSVAVGVRFALDPGGGRRSVPVRAAILGTVVAVLVVSAAAVFGSSLNSLISHPTLYGWNWNYEINGGDGLGDVANNHGQAYRLLAKDPLVASYTGVYFSTTNATIDGQTVAVMGTRPNAAIAPPVLAGHSLQAANQVVLGGETLAQLHTHVGDLVTVRVGSRPATRLRVAGTATLPAIGTGGGLHLEVGSGAILAYTLIPAFSRNVFNVTPGPNAILVRDRVGANPEAARRSLEKIGRTLEIEFNGGAIDGVERPAEIINYKTLGGTPEILGSVLAAGATVALTLTLLSSVRRRRRDLALLKTLGFTQSQLATTIACQSLVAVGLGTVVGLPLGVVFGRLLWDLFAGAANFVPQPTVSAVTIVLVAAGALALACLVAVVPARLASRTETAVLLRAE